MMDAFFPKEDTYRYRGWLVSDHFWKRAFGVFGYGLAAEIVVFLVILAVMGLAGAIGAIINLILLK
jgi:hypothetical protein